MRKLILPLAVAALLAGSIAAQGPVVEKKNIEVDVIRPLPVLDSGRKKPFDSLAREVVRRITQKEVFEKTDPVLLYLHWIFEPEKARKKLVIALPEAAIADRIGFPLQKRVDDPKIPNKLARWVSYDEAMANTVVTDLITRLNTLKDGEELTENENLYLPFVRRVTLFASTAGISSDWSVVPETDRGVLPIIPASKSPDELGSAYRWWLPAHLSALMLAEEAASQPNATEGAKQQVVQQRMAIGWDGDEVGPALKNFRNLRAAFIADDGAAFASASTALLTGLRGLNAPAYPDAMRIEKEVAYNVTHPFVWAQWLYVLASLFALSTLIFKSRIVYWMTFLPLLAGIGIHTWGIVQRTGLSQAMIGNFFESLVYISAAIAVCGAAFGLWFYRKPFIGRCGLLAGSMLAWPVVIAAMDSPNSWDSKIDNLQPVLINNYWIHIHVPTIVLSYVFLAFATFAAHFYLLTWMVKPKAKAALGGAVAFIRHTTPWGVALLFIGMVLGGLWADVSWGRFWGFDPKETWSLITFLAFIAVIHGQWTGWLRDFGTALTTLMCGWALLWTYWGANFIQKGLHSYAAANVEAIIPTWFKIYAGVQIGIVVLSCILWKLRGGVITNPFAGRSAQIGRDERPEPAAS